MVLMKFFVLKQLKEWNKQRTTPWKRKLHFIPQKYNSLRAVPAYDRFVSERFQRCLDLYLCPRARKMRVSIICTRCFFNFAIQVYME
jgi:ribosome biogenesis protein ERB1